MEAPCSPFISACPGKSQSVGLRFPYDSAVSTAAAKGGIPRRRNLTRPLLSDRYCDQVWKGAPWTAQLVSPRDCPHPYRWDVPRSLCSLSPTPVQLLEHGANPRELDARGREPPLCIACVHEGAWDGLCHGPMAHENWLRFTYAFIVLQFPSVPVNLSTCHRGTIPPRDLRRQATDAAHLAGPRYRAGVIPDAGGRDRAQPRHLQRDGVGPDQGHRRDASRCGRAAGWVPNPPSKHLHSRPLGFGSRVAALSLCLRAVARALMARMQMQMQINANKCKCKSCVRAGRGTGPTPTTPPRSTSWRRCRPRLERSSPRGYSLRSSGVEATPGRGRRRPNPRSCARTTAVRPRSMQPRGLWQ